MASQPDETGSPANAPTHAVLMGDLINSEAAGDVNRLHRVFNRAIDRANLREADSLASPLTITLGDEFQGLCRTVSDGLRLMRQLRFELLSEDVPCRFALGVARLETPVGAERAWNMMGPGLAQTREKLSDKRHPNAYRFHLPGEPLLETLLEAIGYAATVTELEWTDRQREITFAAFDNDSPSPQLATELGLATRTFYKIRSSARYDFYQSQWGAMTKAAEALDQRYDLHPA